MFGDMDWDGTRTASQGDRQGAWLRSVAAAGTRLAIVECGAGRAIPTIRRFCEQVARQTDSTLIRINPRESDVPTGYVALPLGAREALQAIDALLGDDQG